MEPGTTDCTDTLSLQSEAAGVGALRIGVVGAGTSGLTLAVLLQRQGHDVTLFERAAQPRTQGCGILLMSRGLVALDQAGLGRIVDELVAAAQPVRRFCFRNLRGDPISSEPANQNPSRRPSLLIRRSVILNRLWSAFDATAFCGGATLKTVDVQQPWAGSGGGSRISATFSDGRHWCGDLLIGADGIHSALAAVVAPERRYHYLGDRVWRGLVQDDQFCCQGDFIVYARGRGIYANIFDLGHDQHGKAWTHWGFFCEEPYPATVALRRQRLAEPPPPAEVGKLPTDVQALFAATPATSLVCNYSFDIDCLPRLALGPMALIGDAAHAMSSSQARGMCTGLEDAGVLAASIAARPGNPLAALAAYDRERRPVVHDSQQRSRQISERTGRRRSAAQPANQGHHENHPSPT